MSVDIEAIRAHLSEYDPDAPRCTKTVAESRNYAPDSMDHNDPEWEAYTVTHYVPCCRPLGHAGECRNSRRVMGWPGRATLIALLDEVESRRKEVSQKRSRAEMDELLARVEQGARAVERDKVVAWLRDGADIDWEPASLQIADAIEQQDRLTTIERANVDRWKDGYAAAERQIAAWLDQPCGMSGHDDRWCPACSFRSDIVNAIRDGKHRAANLEKP